MQHLFSSQVWHMDALAQTKHTPDVQRLYSNLAWNVFLYDDSDKPTRAFGFTEECYTCYRHTDSDALVAIPADHCDIENIPRPTWADPIRRAAGFSRAPATRVKGSIVLMDPADIITIDNDLENGKIFERRRINVLVPFRQLVIEIPGRTLKKPFFQMSVIGVQCWIWEGKKDVFEELINGYDYKPADIMRPDSLWIGDFYTREKART